jgi:hypothetical protein
MKLGSDVALALPLPAILLFGACGSDSQSQQQLTCSNSFIQEITLDQRGNGS